MQITDADRLSYAEVHLERALRILRSGFHGKPDARDALNQAECAAAYLRDAAKDEAAST